MGHTSSRSRSRRARGRACFASTDAFVDVAGITAERAAEGSGSEWSSEESEEKEKVKEPAVVPRPEGVVRVAAGAEAEDAETRVDDDADATPSDGLVPPTPAARRRATRRPPPPAASRGQDAAVLVFLFTNEKGFEAARPVTARLVVARRGEASRLETTATDVSRARSPDPRGSTAGPAWIGSVAERLAGHAGAWPAWDIRQSAKGKTLVATQLEDFERARMYTPTEPPHDGRKKRRGGEDGARDALGDDEQSELYARRDAETRPLRGSAGEKGRATLRKKTPPRKEKKDAPPMPWSPDLTESERAARWRYAGGGMHQPVAEASPAERWVAGKEKTKRKGTFGPESLSGGVASLSAVTAEALETRAEVALAVDGERALSPRAAAAAKEVARSARESLKAGTAAASSFSGVRKRAKTPPASDTRLPLPATSLAEEGTAGTTTAAFASAESSKLWGAWSPSVQRRRRRRLGTVRDDRGGSSGYEEEEEDRTDPRVSDSNDAPSSDFETPAATRDGTPTRDEDATAA